jgi:hypothetical protein
VTLFLSANLTFRQACGPEAAICHTPLPPLVSMYQSFDLPFTRKDGLKTHSLSVLFWPEGPAKMSCWFLFKQLYMNSLIT